MNPRQQRFVHEYLISLNATDAARRAGYAPKAADVQAARLLGNARVKGAIDAALARRAQRLEVTADRVVAELAKLAFANMADYVTRDGDGPPVIDLTQIDPDRFAAIGEITVDEFTDGKGEDARAVRRVRVKLHDKRAALVDLGRHLALFTDNVKLGGAVTTKLEGIDRPPRETREEWEARRRRELGAQLATLPPAGVAE